MFFSYFNRFRGVSLVYGDGQVPEMFSSRIINIWRNNSLRKKASIAESMCSVDARFSRSSMTFARRCSFVVRWDLLWIWGFFHVPGGYLNAVVHNHSLQLYLFRHQLTGHLYVSYEQARISRSGTVLFQELHNGRVSLVKQYFCRWSLPVLRSMHVTQVLSLSSFFCRGGFECRSRGCLSALACAVVE